MSLRGTELRKRLFEKMAADLSTVLAGKPNVVLCPLCMREFGLDDLESKKLDIEHVIPKSAGGTVLTLTCHRCNIECGSEIDSHFARKVRFDEALRTGGELGARLKGKDLGAPAYLTFAGQQLHIRLDPTTPRMAEILQDRFGQYAAGERALHLNIIDNIDQSKLVAAMVKVAYLGVFVDWGYRYAMLPMLDWIRKGIRESGKERDCFLKIVVNATLTDFTDLAEEPTRISFDAICGGIKVSCSVINGVLSRGAFWVFLPPISDLNTGACDGLRRAADAIKGKSVRITFTPEGLANIDEMM
jgi:HNH endonuclease